MQKPGLQQIADPQDHLGEVDGFGEEVPRARAEGALDGRRRRVAGQDERGKVATGRVRGEVLQHAVPVEVRHVEVHEHEIRPEFGEPRDRFERVRITVHVHQPRAGQKRAQQRDIHRIVVDDQHPRVGESGEGHRRSRRRRAVGCFHKQSPRTIRPIHRASSPDYARRMRPPIPENHRPLPRRSSVRSRKEPPDRPKTLGSVTATRHQDRRPRYIPGSDRADRAR